MRKVHEATNVMPRGQEVPLQEVNAAPAVVYKPLPFISVASDFDGPIAFIDLDGCLVDDSWRLGHIRQDMPACDQKWAPYHEASMLDAPTPHAHALLDILLNLGFKFVVVTARPEAVRAITHARFEELYHDIHRECMAVLMRPDGDNTPSPVIKAKLINEYMGGMLLARGDSDQQVPSSVYRVGIDDRDDICEMYEAMNIPAIKLNVSGAYDPNGIIPYLESLDFLGAPEDELIPDKQEEIAAADAAPGVRIGVPEGDVPEDERAAPIPAGAPLPAFALGAGAIASAYRVLPQRGAQYRDSSKITSQVLGVFASVKGTSIVGRTEFRDSAQFNAAIVKLTHFVVSGLRNVDALADMCGYIDQISLLQLAEPSAPIRRPVTGKLEFLARVASDTEERAAMYGQVYVTLGRIMAIYFPSGIEIHSDTDRDLWHNFELIIAKICRLHYNRHHHDSSVDTCALSAMIAPMCQQHSIVINVDSLVEAI